MIDYEDNLCILLRIKGKSIPTAFVSAIPAAALAVVLCSLDEWDPNIRKDSGINDITESQLWNAMTAVIAILLGFRIRQALGRFWEGTSLLHQMRGEWFDAASCLVSFSRDAKLNKDKKFEVMEFRHTLVRLMSLMHGSALDEISDNGEDKYEVLDIHGIDVETLLFLKACATEYHFNRVEALQHMIQVLVTHNHHSGVLTIPPPILSRVYQTLSRGLVNLLNAKKIKDTMFPFPFAQIIRILLIWQTIFTPVLMSQIVANKVCAALLSFLPIFGMFSLNCVSIELEMPFGSDTNDLPLHHFQEEMNQTLLMLVHDMADHLPHTCKRAVRNFDALCKFTRKTLVEGTGKAHSDSKSFMRKDFFEGDFRYDHSVRMSNESGMPESMTFVSQESTLSAATAITGGASLSRLGSIDQFAPTPGPTPADAPVMSTSQYSIGPAAQFAAQPPILETTLEQTTDASKDAGAAAREGQIETLPLADLAEDPVAASPQTGLLDADKLLASSLLAAQKQEKRQLTMHQAVFARCCIADPDQETERSMQFSARPDGSTEHARVDDYLRRTRMDDVLKPAELSVFLAKWINNTELLIQELRINSSSLEASTKALMSSFRLDSQEHVQQEVRFHSETLVKNTRRSQAGTPTPHIVSSIAGAIGNGPPDNAKTTV